MRVADVPQSALAAALAGGGLTVQTGSLRTRIHSRLGAVASGLAEFYCEFPCDTAGEASAQPFADFHVSVRRPLGLRRWYRPHVLFDFDGRSIFKPLPLAQAFPMLEWGLNWCVTTQVNHFLMFHAAVVARGDRALLMPGPPGSGKSTLCAALVARGWRLLSDELALVDLESGELHGLARPVSLKNASIDAIRAFAPDAFVGDPCHDTLKGTVAHMRPPTASVQRATVPAYPAWVVFPRFDRGAAIELAPVAPEEAFFRLVENAFNYAALGVRAFERTVDLVGQSDCHDLVYSSLQEAVACLGALDAGNVAGSAH